MRYPYKCDKCDTPQEIIKRVSEIDSEEICSQCGNILTSQNRKILPNGIFYGETVEDAYYDHSLGKVVKSSKEARNHAKEKGWVEVGTEPVEKIHKHFDDQRRKREEDSWNELKRPRCAIYY